MSSVVLSGDAVRRRERAKSGRLTKRFFIIAIVVLLLVLSIEIVFHLVIAPRLLVRNIDITSDTRLGLDSNAILTLAELDGNTYFFDVQPDAVVKRLEAYPLIKSAIVEKAFPNTLKIHVAARRPLAIALVDGGEETGAELIPVAFDDDGVVFQIGTSVEDYDLPIVSGLTFAGVRLGQRIARPLIGFLGDLHALRKGDPGLFNLISEVKFVKKNRSSFEVVLYPKDYPVRIQLGSTIDSELMKRVVLVLDVFSKRGFEGIREIDFRTEEIVMRVEGDE